MSGDDFNLTCLAVGGSCAASVSRAMERIGVSPYACRHMSWKGDFFALRAENLRAPAANILKQEFLAKGADAAVNSQVILGQPERSSVLMLATAAQYGRICRGLRRQQFGLPALADEIEQALINIRQENWQLSLGGGRVLPLGGGCRIMGILNLTPDSFSDGGSYASVEQAVDRALQMRAEGAYIIDVGGESTRPGHQQISIEEEIGRVVPVIRRLKAAAADLPVSIDTYKPQVVAAALAAGADIINDIWGLQYPADEQHQMAALAAEYGCPVVVMHNRDNIASDLDVSGELPRFFRQARQIARAAGVKDEQLILDIGFGFGKTPEQNMQALAYTAALRILGRPILVAASRKSTLGLLCGQPVDKRLLATAAVTAQAALAGAALVRVHDVAAAADVLAVSNALYKINIGEELHI